ncbi:MAG: UDP-3-O-(3-hydroxymyristoyl)glucosamine N-acyltransferase [Phycisphaerae bacterium]|nr:UDP-3-O-(3-hydroxymyristoyl)glucosamine N-acyltransferase [Phycisphaerae bacterium]
MTLREIAERIGATVDGDASLEVSAVAALDEATAGDLSFALDKKHLGQLSQCKASAVIVSADAPAADGQPALLRVNDANAAMAKLLGFISQPEDVPPAGVNSSAIVTEDATVAPDAAIGPHVVIGPRATIAAGTILCAGVKIGADVTIGGQCMLAEGVVVRYGCRIGEHVRVGPNSVIGSDGYGYYFADGVHHKIPHAGNVVIEDHVELGACTCVDRAKWGSTRIGAGTKVDNLVQIAHNVQIGPGSLLVAQVGIAGSAKLGNFVVLGGGTGVRDNITLGDGVKVAAHAAVAQSVEAGEVLIGTPARPAANFMRENFALQKLPELLKRVKKLEAALRKMEPHQNNQEK